MQLEEIYEAQLYKTANDELNEEYQKVLQSLNATGLAFTRLKMKLGEQSRRTGQEYYRASIQKIELMEKEFSELVNSYDANFIQHSFTNHPNQETRKDLV